MTKLQSQYEDLQKAVKRLKEASALPAGDSINQDATIQRFEFTFELAWKTMQTVVQENIKDVYGPKQVIREAAKLGLIDDPVTWLDFLRSRNLTVHTYHEEVAKEVYKSAKAFVPYGEKLLGKITSLQLIN